MGTPGFWDNPESSREVIQEVKSLKAATDPVQRLLKRIEDAENEVKRIIHGFGFAGKEHIALAEKLISEPPKERFDRVILDKNVRVGRKACVGWGVVVPNEKHPYSLSSGVTIVGKGSTLPPEIRIGRGCILAPDMTESHFSTPEIPSGAMVIP
jgi:hypothetical protein